MHMTIIIPIGMANEQAFMWGYIVIVAGDFVSLMPQI